MDGYYFAAVQSADLVNYLKSNPFLLAPMAGITDQAFRVAMRRLGCGVVISELVSANGLHHASQKTKDLMRYSNEERPVGIQVFGENGNNLAEATKYIEDMGADFVDLNLGCPVKKIVCKGAGSALLKDLVGLSKILTQMSQASSLPLTIKIRTGWDHQSKNALAVANVAHECGVTWVAIHGRTRSQGYNGQADWDYIREVKAQAPLPIIGNGDLVTPELAVSRLRESGCNGVMIGRGCLKNPWIFLQAKELWASGEAAVPERNFLGLFDQMLKDFKELYDEKFVMIQMKKFAAWYSAGYPGSAEFRKSIYAAKCLNTTLESMNTYYQQSFFSSQKDTSQEKFLMGGHG